MCGLIFVAQSEKNIISRDRFEQSVNLQSWRGPDSTNIESHNNDLCLFGHNRLSIIDPHPSANMPMRSSNGRYILLFNGEIYNHLALRKKLNLECRTGSDSETIIEGWSLLKEKLIPLLDGMYALVIYDLKDNSWICARDQFGIKPLYIHRDSDLTIIGSEASVVAKLCNSAPCEQSIEEWRLIRRPLPGKTFFKSVFEIMPGTINYSNGKIDKSFINKNTEEFNQSELEEIITESVRCHQMNDFESVTLLSGGLDSAIITALSSTKECYSVGLTDNNEFIDAKQTAEILGRKINCISINSDHLKNTWKRLTILRGEPLSVPNEGLIYEACRAMNPQQKVVLTGEGADELFFGYDRIFGWAEKNEKFEIEEFMERYGYSGTECITPRLNNFLKNLAHGKNTINFVEDFFLEVHLPCLLRRMDFASMAASKEARVPFITRKIIEYMYRRPLTERFEGNTSKAPLRKFAQKLGLDVVNNRKKIGFSARIEDSNSTHQEYARFQSIILESLGW